MLGIRSVVQYEVNLYTGDLWNAGTDSTVFLTLFGDRGDSGVRQMCNRKKNGNSFVKGKVIHLFSSQPFDFLIYIKFL